MQCLKSYQLRGKSCWTVIDVIGALPLTHKHSLVHYTLNDKRHH